MRINLSSLLLLLAATSPCLSSAEQSTFVWDSAVLAANKTALAEPDLPLTPAVDSLIADAERALLQPPVSVMDKAELPPSGDRHDYMSIALYAWPNPDTADGLPYIRKDGEVSPMAYAIPDKRNKSDMLGAVETLSLAYYFTGDERYAGHAALLLRTWFIDPATRMNPNLRYAQAWPGVNDGRCWGIIDTAGLSLLPDYVALLSPSPHWNAGDHAGMVRWCAEYKDWLTGSDFGKAEEATRNNHGSWWDCQVVALALFCGDIDTARRVCEQAKERRIAAHLAADGSQPHELARTKSWDYSVYNLQALVRLAQLARHTGTAGGDGSAFARDNAVSGPPVDLWGYVSPQGVSIAGAIDYLLPYAAPGSSAADSSAPATWPHRQITEIEVGGFADILRTAAAATEHPRFSAAARRFNADLPAADRRWLLQPGFAH